MLLLALKLVLSPLLLLGATLAGRRWGPGVSGWLAALPLSSGPVSLIFALQNGKDFAAHAAVGTLAGLVSVSAYCVVYCRLARTQPWHICIGAAVVTFFATTAILYQLPLALLPTYAAVLATLTVALRLIPPPPALTEKVTPPQWDLPARVLTAIVFVLLLSYAAEWLGPQLSGLLSPFPIFATILAVFAHAQHGASAAILSQRGILTGLYAFASFFLTVGLLVTVLPIPVTYAAAVLVALSVNLLTLRFIRSEKRAAFDPEL